jgi:hypothetical protein
MRFSFRQLEYFVAAGESGSVTRAAAGSHSTQPTVSAAIAKLERTLGVQLFVRHHAQGLSLTPEGRRFLAEAKTLLRHASEVERFATTLSDEVAGTLDLACLVTLAPLVTPSLVREFRAAHPRVNVELVESHQQGLLDRLRGGLSSIALTYDLQLPADIDFQPLADRVGPLLTKVDERLPTNTEALIRINGAAQLGGGQGVERVGGRSLGIGGGCVQAGHSSGLSMPGTPAGVIERWQCSLKAVRVRVSRMPRSDASPSRIGRSCSRSGSVTTRPPSSAVSVRGRAFTSA